MSLVLSNDHCFGFDETDQDLDSKKGTLNGRFTFVSKPRKWWTAFRDCLRDALDAENAVLASGAPCAFQLADCMDDRRKDVDVSGMTGGRTSGKVISCLRFAGSIEKDV